MTQSHHKTPPCIILAGGLGTRLRGVISDLPKCLAPVGKKSFLEIQIGMLRRAGIEDFILSLGYMAERVVEALAAFENFEKIRFAVEPEPLGTGGALAFIMDQFDLQDVLVMNGDTIVTGDLSTMFQPLSFGSQELLRVACLEVENVARYGCIGVNGTGRIVSFGEKRGTGPGLINCGIYHLNRSVFGLRSRTFFSFENEIVPSLVKHRKAFSTKIKGEFIDIGIPEDYERFCTQYKNVS